MNDTRITVFGATGAVGSLVVREALNRGLAVTALVRDPARLAPDLAASPDVKVVHGEIDDRAAVAEALDGSAAVILALGLRYRRRHPWGGIDGRTDVVPAAVTSVLEAAGHAQTRPAVVLLSAFGAGDSWAKLPWIFRAIVSSSALRISYAGLSRAEELLLASGVRHTVVRAVSMTDAPASGRSADATGLALRGNPKVSRTDVAALLVDAATGTSGPGTLVAATRPAGS
jgi:uncharacterized protein YbjT (DUF2867 family)